MFSSKQRVSTNASRHPITREEEFLTTPMIAELNRRIKWMNFADQRPVTAFPQQGHVSTVDIEIREASGHSGSDH